MLSQNCAAQQNLIGVLTLKCETVSVVFSSVQVFAGVPSEYAAVEIEVDNRKGLEIQQRPARIFFQVIAETVLINLTTAIPSQLAVILKVRCY